MTEPDLPKHPADDLLAAARPHSGRMVTWVGYPLLLMVPGAVVRLAGRG